LKILPSLDIFSPSTATAAASGVSLPPHGSQAHACLACGAETKRRNLRIWICGACAKFFRLTIDGERSYRCEDGGNCTITCETTMCRKCRFDKLVLVNPKYVKGGGRSGKKN